MLKICHLLSQSRGCPGCQSVQFVQMERAVSIRIQSENSISLKGYKSSPTRVKGGDRACRSVRFEQMERAIFHSYTVGQLHFIKGT